MTSTTPAPLQFQVKGMSCQHCVRAVTQAIQTLDAQAQVDIELARGEVQVRSTLPRDRIAEAIREEGYEVMA